MPSIEVLIWIMLPGTALVFAIAAAWILASDLRGGHGPPDWAIWVGGALLWPIGLAGCWAFIYLTQLTIIYTLGIEAPWYPPVAAAVATAGVGLMIATGRGSYP